MSGFVWRLLANMLALWLTAVCAHALKLGLHVENFVAAFWAAIVLGLINTFLGPLVRLMALPLTCLTLGLFGLVVNAFLFWLAGQGIVPGFKVEGFLAPLFGSIVMSVFSGILQTAAPTDHR
jgi:putative membrane protein